MKTSSFFLSVAALGALVLFPPSFEVCVSVLFAAGLVGLLISDYAEVIRPRPMCRVAATVPPSAIERWRLAA